MTSAADQIEITSCRVFVGGGELPAEVVDKLVSVKINRGLSMTGRSVLRFDDFGYELAKMSTFQLGGAVEIRAGSDSLFKGVITGTALEHSMTQLRQEFVVTADDKSFKLGLTKRIRTFENVKLSDLITTFAGEAGLSGDVQSPGDPQQPYVLQNGTDLALLDSITKRLNCVWWVDGAALKVRPAADVGRSAVTDLDLLKDLGEFSVRATGLRPSAASVTGWDPKAKQDIEGNKSDPSYAVASGYADNYSGAKRKGLLGAADFLATQSLPTSKEEAEFASKSLQATWQGDAIVARGLSYINAKVAPYAVVQVSSAGPASGKYQISEVEHTFSNRGFYTRFTAGGLRQSALVDKLSVPAPATGFVSHGLTTAIVSDVGGGSDKTAFAGMVKVKFAGLTGDVASAWARVLSFGGGDQRGGVFLPEIGDEVLVGFENGDTRRPVVLGALFNGKDKVAADDKVVGSDGKVAYRRITSRKNNTIEFGDGDTPDKQHVAIAAVSADQQLRIGADRGDIKYPDGKPFKITVGSSSLEFDGKGNITIEGMKITLKADSDIEIQATNNLTAKGTAKIALQGAQAELKGDTQVNVQGGLQASLKAAIVKIN